MGRKGEEERQLIAQSAVLKSNDRAYLLEVWGRFPSGRAPHAAEERSGGLRLSPCYTTGIYAEAGKETIVCCIIGNYIIGTQLQAHARGVVYGTVGDPLTLFHKKEPPPPHFTIRTC